MREKCAENETATRIQFAAKFRPQTARASMTQRLKSINNRANIKFVSRAQLRLSELRRSRQ